MHADLYADTWHAKALASELRGIEWWSEYPGLKFVG